MIFPTDKSGLPPPHVSAQTHKDNTVGLQLSAGALQERQVEHFLVVVAKQSLVDRTRMEPGDINMNTVSSLLNSLSYICIKDLFVMRFKSIPGTKAEQNTMTLLFGRFTK